MSTSETGVSPARNANAESLSAQDLTSELNQERQGLRGAAVIAAIAVGLLFLGWLAFYFELYLRRANGG